MLAEKPNGFKLKTQRVTQLYLETFSLDKEQIAWRPGDTLKQNYGPITN